MAEEKRTEKKKVAENTPACRLEPEGHALADRTRFVAASSRHFNSHRVKREWYVIKKKKKAPTAFAHCLPASDNFY